jgi:hypothetical protein
MVRPFTFILVTSLFFGCDDERNFPDVKKLTEFPQTEFILTLEQEFSKEKNSIYSASLLFAWEEIRNQLDSPLIVEDEYEDLKLLHNSTSFLNVLSTDEFTATGEIDGTEVFAHAEFSKSLPFEQKLHEFEDKLSFAGRPVLSFGVRGMDSYEQRSVVRIIYYENDNNLIIKLLPKDRNHEIVLFKTDQDFRSMAEMIEAVQKLTKVGKIERENEKTNWRYHFNEGDVLQIPQFNFNIETNFTTLEQSMFIAGRKNYQVVEAWQRNAFILDELGAKVESEAEFEVTEDMVEEYEIPKPKQMIFDRPFFVLLKRLDNSNPYFALWASNAELMVSN